MAVTIVAQPPRFNFSDNPILLTLSSSRYLINAGQTGYYLADFSSKYLLGETLTFTWHGGSVGFTVVSTPNDSGTQINPTGANVNEWLTSNLPFFKANYLLSQFFTIEVVSDALKFTPKELQENMSFSGDEARYTINNSNAPVSPVYNRDVSILVRLVMVDSVGNETRLPNLIVQQYKSENVTLNLSKTIQDYLLNILPSEVEGLAHYDPYTKTNRNFYAEIAEYDTAQNLYYAVQRSGTFKVQKGGYSLDLYQNNLPSTNNDEVILLSHFTEQNAMLDEEAYFFFLINAASGEWAVNASANYLLTDKSTGTAPLAATFNAALLTPIKFKFLLNDLLSYESPGVRVVSATVTLSFLKDFAATNLSLTFKFKRVEQGFKTNVWVYENSFGVPQKLLTTNTYAELDIDTDKEEFQKVLPNNPTSESQQTVTYLEEYQEEIATATDPIPYSKARLLTKLLNSSALYLKQNGQWFSYFIASGKAKLGENNNSLTPVEFKAKRSVKHRNV